MTVALMQRKRIDETERMRQMAKLEIVGYDKTKSVSDGTTATTHFELSGKPSSAFKENFDDIKFKERTNPPLFSSAELNINSKYLIVQSPSSVKMNQVLEKLNGLFDKVNATEDDYEKQLSNLQFRKPTSAEKGLK